MPDEPAAESATADAPVGRPLWVWVRRAAVSAWAISLVAYTATAGLPVDRRSVLIWTFLGLVAGSVGRRGPATVLIDFAPLFVLVLIYGYLHGAADGLGMPTQWHAQLDVDKFLFFGHVPTVWLQEHLKYASPQWWEAPVALIYVSYFALPVITAGALWLRSRLDFYRWSARFITVALLAFVCFALVPAAPPWAAARCTAADVAHHPADPACMHEAPRLAHGGLLGRLDVVHSGAQPYVTRISSRGFDVLHIHPAAALLKTGQATSDLVAAVPSLHSAGVMLFAIFMWGRVRRAWRVLLVLYPPVMGFVLVFTGEHYVTDVLLGWALAVLVSLAARWVERRLGARRTGDADPEPDPEQPALSSAQ
jgi:membrane-associated phospholipid phosphatase